MKRTYTAHADKSHDIHVNEFHQENEEAPRIFQRGLVINPSAKDLDREFAEILNAVYAAGRLDAINELKEKG
jgi:hypothetical protein